MCFQEGLDVAVEGLKGENQDLREQLAMALIQVEELTDTVTQQQYQQRSTSKDGRAGGRAAGPFHQTSSWPPTSPSQSYSPRHQSDWRSQGFPPPGSPSASAGADLPSRGRGEGPSMGSGLSENWSPDGSSRLGSAVGLDQVGGAGDQLLLGMRTHRACMYSLDV